MRNTIVFSLLSISVLSQPYLKENGKTRHRFAQSVFGVDLQTSVGGNSFFVNENGDEEKFFFNSQVNPRIYISGTHFWGHAEFYFAIQLNSLNRLSHAGNNYFYSQSDIFGTKIYPWPVQRKKLRPFAGMNISGTSFRQYNGRNSGLGPLITRLKFPATAGFNYCAGSWLFDFTFTYNYNNSLPYYIRPGSPVCVKAPPYLFSFGIRKWFETTVAAEKPYYDGSIEKHYRRLKDQKKLSSWLIGIGPSSAFYLRISDYNKTDFPFMDKPFSTVFPELSAGYFYEPFGLHIVSAFRYNSAKQKAYGLKQQYQRASLSFESYKYLFDYHGFNPFLGACVSGEFLKFSHTSDTLSFSASTSKMAPGIIFGWDILPDKLQALCLRTNLRYFPGLAIDAHGKKVFFDQLEFNFIQLIFYPQRMKRFKAQDQ